MTMYMDNRGWRYRVMPGLGDDTYKARYQKPDSQRWICMAKLPWRTTPESAQEDLDVTARKKGWTKLGGETHAD